MPGGPAGVTGSAVFHLLASLFGLEAVLHECVPVEKIRQLRGEGLSLAEVAARTGTTVAVVRRIVGKLDHNALRQRQEETARRIDAEPLPWKEKARKWKEETGHSEVTIWRVLDRGRHQL